MSMRRVSGNLREMQDELLYAAFLTGHIAFGALVIDRAPPGKRRLVCTLLGLATSIFLTRWEFLHQLALVMAIVSVIELHRRTKRFNLHLALNGVAFGYLLYFRFCCDNNFSNMIMMMLVLRMGGLGTEPGISSDPKADPTQTPREASILNVIHYAFSYIGFLCGPYIRFRTFTDYMDGICPTTFAQRRGFLKPRLMQLPILTVAFLASTLCAPVHAARTEEFHREHGFLYAIGYMVVMCIGCRSRLCIGFILAECGCISAGMGAYPKHWDNSSGEGYKSRKLLMESLSGSSAASAGLEAPKRQDRQERPSLQRLERAIDFNTVKNVDVWEVESAPTLKQTMRAWNQTVQYWLVVNCHKMVPFRSRGARIAATFAVSAFWHGVRPGYYLCIVTMTFFQMAEDHIVRHFTQTPLFQVPSKAVSRILFAQIKMTVLAYLTVSFVLMHWAEIFQYYQSLYFFGHLACAVVLLWSEVRSTRRVSVERLVGELPGKRPNNSKKRSVRSSKPSAKAGSKVKIKKS